MPLAIRHQAKKAIVALKAKSALKTLREKSSGAKTARFLVHCLGRSARASESGSGGGFSAAGGAGEAGLICAGSLTVTSPPPDSEVGEALLAHARRVEDVAAVEDHRL